MGFWDKAYEACKNTGETAKDAGQDFVNHIDDTAQEGAQQGQQAARRGGEAVGSAAAELLQGAAAVATRVAGGARGALGAAGAAAARARDDLSRQVERSKGVIRGPSGDVFGGARNSVESAGAWLKRATGDAVHYRERPLNYLEQMIEWRIFHQMSGRFTSVAVSSGLGRDRRCFTDSRPSDPTAPNGALTYVLFMGPEAYSQGCTRYVLNSRGRPMDVVLAHELTHVWQSRNGLRRPSDEIGKVWAYFDDSAYSVTPNQPWSSYNMEQQAEIVAMWWHYGAEETSNEWRWPYIRDNVRRGR